MLGAMVLEREKSRVAVLEDKVVIVTGAGGGIGRGIALAMAAAGARVVVNDVGADVHGEGKNASPGQRVVDEILSAGGEAVLSTDSVATWPSATAIVQCALDSFGRLDAVVNNAGILRDRFFFKMDPEEWSAVIDVHLNGTFFVSRAAAPHFKSQESGAYIHMTSTSGLIGGMGQANYGAAKAGIAGLSRSIAIDMSKFGVRSNAIAPFAWSRMIGAIPTDTPEQQLRVERLKKMDADKVAPLAAYLVSDGAADISGQIFSVRANEIFTLGQSRPLRSVHRAEGWTVETVADHAIPALRSSFYPLEMTRDVFCWDPI